MKKNYYFIFTLLCMFLMLNSVKADTLGFCAEEGIQRTFGMIGYGIYIFKVLIPVLLIIFGSIDFAKAVIADKDDEIKKSAISFAKRIVAGVIIFFVPTVINFVFSLVDDLGNNNSNYAKCTECMEHPSTCIKKLNS